MTHSIDPRLGLVLVRWTGVVGYEEAVAHSRALASDPAFRPSMRQLSDARDAQTIYSSEEVRGLARLSPYGPRSRRAILVASDVLWGATRMYAAQVPQGNVHVFRHLDAALAWLGLSPSDLAAIDALTLEPSARPHPSA